MENKCAVLFSGGSDSLCAAALCCESFKEVHLLTFFERATQASPVPSENVERLRNHYPAVKIEHFLISTDKFTRELSYKAYLKNLIKYGLMNLATPGLSSLGWHIAAIIHSRRHGINRVFDGMTKELLHLPGHMPEIRNLFLNLYADCDFTFGSQVIDWDIPEDQRFVDKLIVDRHGFGLKPKSKVRTTGQWLFDRKLLPHPNVKGSNFDRLMQHDCYPFVVYNMLVFWVYEPIIGYEKYKHKLGEFMNSKLASAKSLIERNELTYE